MRRRPALLAVSAMLLLAACDPGASSTERSDADRYDAWVSEFADERDGWSTTWVALVKEMQANGGSFSADARIDWATRLGDAAGTLDDAMSAAGDPPSPPAGPTYIHAVHATLGEAVSSADESVSCQAEACVEPFVRLIKLGHAAETLVLQARNASVLLSAPAVRDVPVADAVLSPAAAGAQPYDRRLEPVDILCTPEFEGDIEDGVELPESVEKQQMGGETSPGEPVYESLYRFETKAVAATYFQLVAVRTVMCDLEPAVNTNDGSRLAWSSEVAPQLGTPTLGWRIRLDLAGDAEPYRFLVLGALVDDTVVFVGVGSSAGEPSAAQAERLLRTGLEALGVTGDELAASGS